ncbi:glutathione S-transferase [Rhodospirillales bacterium]|nr:glutathione S-transferase [Rhodospirillales bacterium]
MTQPPILYSFRRCPYAMRARMALSVSMQAYELREVLLRDKPPELIEVSPKATVPILEVPHLGVIDQSLDIMLWALNKNDPYSWLLPERGNLEQMLALIEKNDGNFKYNLDRYKYPNRFDDLDAKYFRGEGEKFIAELDKLLETNNYLFGEKPALADYAIGPFVRQFVNTDKEWFDGLPYVSFKKWFDQFSQSEIFLGIMKKYNIWNKNEDPIYISIP